MIQWPLLTFPPLNLWTIPKMNVDTSPCKKQCLYDNRYGFCVECGRRMQEIANWNKFTSTMKANINRRASERLELVKRDK